MEMTIEQQKENREKWFEALESKKYDQCQRTLALTENGDTKYCCLGVAACVKANRKLTDTEMYSYDEITVFLGLKHTVGDSSHLYRFWELNDIGEPSNGGLKRLSFPEIAQYARNHPELFES